MSGQLIDLAYARFNKQMRAANNALDLRDSKTFQRLRTKAFKQLIDTSPQLRELQRSQWKISSNT